MTEVKSYRDLIVWRDGVDIATDIYKLTNSFPKEETYGLSSQLRRAAVSIASNIAEGYGRNTTGSYVQFLKTARGSINEIETQLEISCRIGLTSSERIEQVLGKADKLGRMISSLVRSIENSPRAGE